MSQLEPVQNQRIFINLGTIFTRYCKAWSLHFYVKYVNAMIFLNTMICCATLVGKKQHQEEISLEK